MFVQDMRRQVFSSTKPELLLWADFDNEESGKDRNLLENSLGFHPLVIANANCILLSVMGRIVADQP